MPIRINLLAEAQALEELRRRDPVKRVIWAGVFLVCLLLAVSSWLQLQVIIRKGELNRVQGQLASRTNEFQQVLQNQNRLTDVNGRLSALRQLACNRMLYGTLLNSLQQTVIDDVQLTRLRADQAFVLNEEIKPKTNSNNRIIPGRPASVTEKVVVTMEARDSGPNAGDQVNKFKQTVRDNAYFQAALGKSNEVRLVSLSPPQVGEKPYVQFVLEARFPEKTR